MIRAIALVLVLGLLVVGCVHQPGGIAASSTPVQPGAYTTMGKVEGASCLWRLFGFIPLGPGNTTEKARDDAISKKSGANALVDVTADFYTQFWLLAVRDCTEVRGVAIQK